MKLMIVTPAFHPGKGGVQKYVYELSIELIKSYKIDIVIICPWKKWFTKKVIFENMKIYYMPYIFKISSTPINPFWYGKIESLIDKEKPDIINGHMPVPYIADIAARIAHKKNIPFILTYHNDLTGYNPIIRFLSKCYYKFLGNRTMGIPTIIIATSEYYASLSHYLKKYFDKLEIVSPGVDINRFHMLEYSYKKGNTILFVGRLDKESQHKGLNYLLDALKIVLNMLPELKLIVVGNGNYINHYKKLVLSIGLMDSVIFTGFLEDGELSSYYNKSDVLVLPSYNMAEGFGMVLIEAQACGTPVIGTNVGGIPYAINDGETGLIVPHSDPQSIANAILKILVNENIKKEMGMKGYERVRKEFTWKNSAGKMFKILNNMK